MPVRIRKSQQRRPRHFKILQHSVIHQRHALCRHAFIVILVVAQQILLDPASSSSDRQSPSGNFRQNLFAHLLRKRLPLRRILLPVALRAMSEHFVKKYRGRASGQSAGLTRGSFNGAATRPSSSFRMCRSRRHTPPCHPARPPAHPIKIVITLEVHSVRRLALNEQFQPVTNLPVLKLRPFARHLIRVLRLRCERHDRIDHRRRRPKFLRIRAHFRFPWLAIHLDRNLGTNVCVRLLVREVRRSTFRRLNFHFLARLDLDQGFRRRAILLVRLEPNRAPQYFRIVVDRRRCARTAALLLPVAPTLCELSRS